MTRGFTDSTVIALLSVAGLLALAWGYGAGRYDARDTELRATLTATRADLAEADDRVAFLEERIAHDEDDVQAADANLAGCRAAFLALLAANDACALEACACFTTTEVAP